MKVSKKGEKFHCERCGNEVEVTYAGGGELICCGEAMSLVEE
jgi:desulfoferrodoxin-like iron-binding protein